MNGTIESMQAENDEHIKKEEELNKLIEKLEEKLENKKERWDVQIQTGFKTKEKEIQT